MNDAATLPREAPTAGELAASVEAMHARLVAAEARLDELGPLVPLLPLVPVLRAFLDTPAVRRAVERMTPR